MHFDVGGGVSGANERCTAQSKCGNFSVDVSTVLSAKAAEDAHAGSSPREHDMRPLANLITQRL